MTAVLFLCQHNAGRSQLGAHLLSYASQGRLEARSAGITPADTINPAVAATLAELGIDASSAVPRAVSAEDIAHADVVVAMKPGLALPGTPRELIEWQFPDPASWQPGDVRVLRDDVLAAVRELAGRL